MHATNATPNTARGENSPAAESAPATTSAGTAGIGSPSCSSSTFAKTSASPYCAIRRSMRPPSIAGEAPDHAPVARGGPAMRVVRGMRPGAAHRDHVLASHPALDVLRIQQRRRSRGSALERHGAHFDEPLQVAGTHFEPITRPHALARLHALAVELDLAALHRPRGQAARLVKARRPQPLVDAQAPWPIRVHGRSPLRD